MQLVLSFNDDNLTEKARVFKALGNQIHLKIILLLRGGEQSADEIYLWLKGAGLVQKKTSVYKTLQKLVGTGIVETEKKYIRDRLKTSYRLKKGR